MPQPLIKNSVLSYSNSWTSFEIDFNPFPCYVMGMAQNLALLATETLFIKKPSVKVTFTLYFQMHKQSPRQIACSKATTLHVVSPIS